MALGGRLAGLASPLPVLSSLYQAQYEAISLESAGLGVGAVRHRSELLDTLLAYVLCNDLYRSIGLTVTGDTLASTFENVRSIRNPAKAWATFYMDNLWTSPQTVETDNEAIAEPLTQLRKWSNWGHGTAPTHRAALAAFQFSVFGEMFIKTNQRQSDGRPYHVTLDPRHVEEGNLDVDHRGYVEWIRVDQPVMRRDYESGKRKEVIRTEVWDRQPTTGLDTPNWPARVRVWEYPRRTTDATDLSRLSDGYLVERRVYAENGTDADLPVDWIPIAYAAFEALDDGRGWSPLLAALEAIDEACRVVTRGHSALFIASQAAQMLFSDHLGKDGRPMPAPEFADGEEVEIGGIRMYRIPSGFRIADAIPHFDFPGIRGLIENQVEWVKEAYLHELQFYDAVAQMEDPSGRAINYRLAPLLKRPLRARARAEAAKILANQHALTLGQIAGTWEGLGAFEEGAFEHAFARQPLLPRELSEVVLDIATLVGAGASMAAAAEVAGLTEVAAAELADPIIAARNATDLERARFALEAEQGATDRLAAFRAGLSNGGGGE